MDFSKSSSHGLGVQIFDGIKSKGGALLLLVGQQEYHLGSDYIGMCYNPREQEKTNILLSVSVGYKYNLNAMDTTG